MGQNNQSKQDVEIQTKVKPLLPKAPWVLRITEHADKAVPVLVAKERITEEIEQENGNITYKSSHLKDRGHLHGQPLRRCLPVLRSIISEVTDSNGIPLELQLVLNKGRISYRGNLPLNESAGAKLALLFKLQERIKDMDRVELIAWRIQRFTREEAMYWLTRATQYNQAACRWAQSGMRIMLGGQPGDNDIQKMLEDMRK